MASIRIEVQGRKEALELCGHLAAFRCEAVQANPDGWSISVATNGDSDRLAADVIQIVTSWVDASESSCVVEIEGRRFPVHPRQFAA
jgi:hypothetical protein